jgi:hypothetical protein
MTVPHSGSWRGGKWRLAPALIAMEAEADLLAPKRRRTSDGSIGDLAHAVRFSHHNPQESGDPDWVDALDISHDPGNGMDIHAYARAMVARRDDRLEEVISNRKIWTYARRAEGWRNYSGDNPHTLHAHFVVRDSKRHDTSAWFSSKPFFPTPGPAPLPYTPPLPNAVPTEDHDVTAYIRLNQPGHAHHGRVEAIGDFHRRHIGSTEELSLLKFLGAKIVDVSPREWNLFTTNRLPINSSGTRA